MSDDEPTVPCKFCSTPTRMTEMKMCDGCYEVERFIDDLLKSKVGRQLVQERLEAARKKWEL